MNQAMLKEIEETSPEELTARVRSNAPSMFERLEMPEPTRWQMIVRKVELGAWRPIDWLTDRMGYAVWTSAEGNEEI